MSTYTPKILKCRECQNEFVWTIGEQEFYAQKGLEHEPARCKPCRGTRNRDGAAAQHGGPRPTEVTCSNCGKRTTVPFRPTQGRPVYCSDCFQHHQQGGR